MIGGGPIHQPNASQTCGCGNSFGVITQLPLGEEVRRGEKGQPHLPPHSSLWQCHKLLTHCLKLVWERYKAEEEPATLIPVFKEICARAPKSSAAWACLWLYLLDNKGTQAYKAAQKAAITSQDAQARVNLAVAMLERVNLVYATR